MAVQKRNSESAQIAESRSRGTNERAILSVLSAAVRDAVQADEEISHLQADGCWGMEKGFQDAEQH